MKLQRIELAGTYNPSRGERVKEENIIFPPLHLKLGLIKNFVKALARDIKLSCFYGNCCTYIAQNGKTSKIIKKAKFMRP